MKARLKRVADRWIVRHLVPEARIVSYSDTDLRAQRREGFHSQLGQDYFLLTHALDRADAPGFFVEVGCNHPRRNSNSLRMEEIGWKGLSFDALPSFEAEWRRSRRTPFHRFAISARRETREFIMFRGPHGWEHELSGFRETLKPRLLAKLEHDIVPVQCRPLSEFLSPDTEIDVLMIDVEGAEREVLEGAELECFRPRWILVENNRRLGGDTAVRRDIVTHGYRMVARLGGADDLFVHN